VDPGLVSIMGNGKFNRFLGWIFIGGMAALMISMAVMMALDWETWVIAWMTIVTGSVIGMTAGMVVMIKSFKVDNAEESSS
jgi:ABC-type xylose transport system permease subunit